MILDDYFWFAWAARVALNSTLVAAIGLTTMLLTSAHFATQRHLIGVVTCIMLLVLPVVGFCVPEISIFRPRASEVLSTSAEYKSSSIEKTELPAAMSSGRATALPKGGTDTDQTVSKYQGFRNANQESTVGKMPLAEVQTNAQAEDGILYSVIASTGLMVYLVGVVFSISKTIIAHVKWYAYARRSAFSTIEEETIGQLTPDLRQHAHRIRVDASGRVVVPVVTGVWRPLVLLPASASAWSTSKLSAVLAHELAHIQRKDVWTKLIAKIVASLYWPNPLIHCLRNQMIRSQEIACDQMAISSRVDRFYYARVLVEIAKESVKTPDSDALLAMSQSKLESRVSFLLACDDRRVCLHIRHSNSKLLVLALLLLVVTSLNPLAYTQAIAPPVWDTNTDATIASTTDEPDLATPPVSSLVGAVSNQDLTPPESTRDSGVDESQEGSSKDLAIKLRAEGKVVDEHGQPVANTTLAIFPQMESGVTTDLSASNDEGSFLAEYNLAKPTNAGLHTWFYAQGHSIRVAKMRSAFRPYGMKSQQVDGLTIPLPPYEEVQFRVLEPDGTPCEGAIVSPKSIDIPNGVWMSDTSTGRACPLPESLRPVVDARTDALGLATVRSIPRRLLKSVSVESARLGVQVFSLGYSAESPLTLQLIETATIHGIVKTDHTELIAGTRVYLSTVGERLPYGGQWGGIATAAIDEHGRFEAVLAAKNSTLDISIQWPQELDHVPNHPDKVRLDAGDIVNLTLNTIQAVEVRGCVRTADTNLPVTNARISIRSPTPGYTHRGVATTDMNGNYTAKVPPGRLDRQLFEFLPTEDGWFYYDYPGIGDIEIAKSDHSVELAPILVNPMRQIRGKLINAAGEPASGLRIELHYKAGIRMREPKIISVGGAVTGGDGDFSFRVSGGFRQRNDTEAMEWVLVEKPRNGLSPAVNKKLKVQQDDQNDMILQLPD